MLVFIILGAAALEEQLLAQPDFSVLMAPGAAALEEQLLAQPEVLVISVLIMAPGAAVEQLEAQLDFSALTAPGAADADLQQPSVPQQAAAPPEAPGEVVLLLLQPTRVAASETAAIVRKVRMVNSKERKRGCEQASSRSPRFRPGDLLSESLS